jgi:hypothetical protein
MIGCSILVSMLIIILTHELENGNRNKVFDNKG